LFLLSHHSVTGLFDIQHWETLADISVHALSGEPRDHSHSSNAAAAQDT